MRVRGSMTLNPESGGYLAVMPRSAGGARSRREQPRQILDNSIG